MDRQDTEGGDPVLPQSVDGTAAETPPVLHREDLTGAPGGPNRDAADAAPGGRAGAPLGSPPRPDGTPSLFDQEEPRLRSVDLPPVALELDGAVSFDLVFVREEDGAARVGTASAGAAAEAEPGAAEPEPETAEPAPEPDTAEPHAAAAGAEPGEARAREHDGGEHDGGALVSSPEREPGDAAPALEDGESTPDQEPDPTPGGLARSGEAPLGSALPAADTATPAPALDATLRTGRLSAGEVISADGVTLGAATQRGASFTALGSVELGDERRSPLGGDASDRDEDAAAGPAGGEARGPVAAATGVDAPAPGEAPVEVELPAAPHGLGARLRRALGLGVAAERGAPAPPEEPAPPGEPLPVAAAPQGSRAADADRAAPPPRPAPAREVRTSGAGELGRRVATGVAFGVVAVAAFLGGPLTSLALVVVVIVSALAEAYAVLRRSGYRPATFVGLAVTLVTIPAVFHFGTGALPVAWVVALGLSFTWFLGRGRRQRATANLAVTILAFGWVGVFGAYAAALLDPTTFPHRHGVADFAGVVLLTIGYDVGAYLVGRQVGRHPLLRSVSPNKTVEGLVGGVLGAVVAAVVLAHVHPWTLLHALVVAVVVMVVAPLGDLAESLLKRDLRVKDMGTLLPGHGGLLDRIDALLFVLPVAYYVLEILHVH